MIKSKETINFELKRYICSRLYMTQNSQIIFDKYCLQNHKFFRLCNILYFQNVYIYSLTCIMFISILLMLAFNIFSIYFNTFSIICFILFSIFCASDIYYSHLLGEFINEFLDLVERTEQYND